MTHTMRSRGQETGPGEDGALGQPEDHLARVPDGQLAMSATETPAAESRVPSTLQFPFPGADLTWERERDARLDAFIAACLARVEATGCTDEWRIAAGVRSVFAEWSEKRELARVAGSDVLAAQISALGWALRCIAHSAWRTAPGWEPGFHPEAANPENLRETTQ